MNIADAAKAAGAGGTIVSASFPNQPHLVLADSRSDIGLAHRLENGALLTIMTDWRVVSKAARATRVWIDNDRATSTHECPNGKCSMTDRGVLFYHGANGRYVDIA